MTENVTTGHEDLYSEEESTPSVWREGGFRFEELLLLVRATLIARMYRNPSMSPSFGVLVLGRLLGHHPLRKL